MQSIARFQGQRPTYLVGYCQIVMSSHLIASTRLSHACLLTGRHADRRTPSGSDIVGVDLTHDAGEPTEGIIMLRLTSLIHHACREIDKDIERLMRNRSMPDESIPTGVDERD